MPANKSAQKIRVTRLYQSDAVVGWMDPAVNVRCKYGDDFRWIVGLDSGNFQVSLALASGGATIAKAYPHDLVVDTVVASGYGWPTSNESVTFGHQGVFPSGVPEPPGSGMYYAKDPTGTHEFSRLA